MKYKTLTDLFIHNTPEKDAEKILVCFTSELMLKKLAEKRKDGDRGGWHTDRCDNDGLREELAEHMERADPDLDDIINLSAMILCRQALYGDEA